MNTSIRGVTDIVVQVRVLPSAQHSGSYGGPIPDAIISLSRMIASLHDDAGDVAIEGLKRFGWEGTQIPRGRVPPGVGRPSLGRDDRVGHARRPVADGSRGRRAGSGCPGHRRLVEPDRAGRPRPSESPARTG